MPLSYPTTPIGQFFLESHVLLEQGDELLEHTGRVIIEQDHAGGVDGRFGGIMRDERVRILHILPRRDLHHREAYLFKMRCKFIPNCLLICVPRREFPHVKARKQPCPYRKSVVYGKSVTVR